jgi:DNA-binding HxlR family transcriptional regulator
VERGKVSVVLGRLYEGEICSAARALESVGERWSLLIIRDALFRGTTRFSDFQRNLGIAPNILAKRLEDFVAAGIFELRTQDSDRGEYVLTRKGSELSPVIVALTAWGDKWAAPDGPPIAYTHRDCGGRIRQSLECSSCGATPKPTDVVARRTRS